MVTINYALADGTRGKMRGERRAVVKNLNRMQSLGLLSWAADRGNVENADDIEVLRPPTMFGDEDKVETVRFLGAGADMDDDADESEANYSGQSTAEGQHESDDDLVEVLVPPKMF